MSQSLFQKEINDEIFVKEMSIDNPQPALLDVRIVQDGQVFFARPGAVLKSVYSSLDSLDAFGSDGSLQVYALYERGATGGSNVIFLAHYVDPSEESINSHSYWDLPEDIQSFVPQDFR